MSREGQDDRLMIPWEVDEDPLAYLLGELGEGPLWVTNDPANECWHATDKAPTTPHQRQVARQARGEVARATGHRYPDLEKALEGLSAQAGLDLIRLIRNLKDDLMRSEQKRRRGQTW